jgi:hypothetical protein
LNKIHSLYVPKAQIAFPATSVTRFPFQSDVPYFTFWSLTTAFLASFQGFFAALFYCFCNREVQNVVRQSLPAAKTETLMKRAVQ